MSFERERERERAECVFAREREMQIVVESKRATKNGARRERAFQLRMPS